MSTCKNFGKWIFFNVVFKYYWGGPNLDYCTDKKYHYKKYKTFSCIFAKPNKKTNHCKDSSSYGPFFVWFPFEEINNKSNWINLHIILGITSINNSAYLDPYEKVKGFDVLSRSCTNLKSSVPEVI